MPAAQMPWPVHASPHCAARAPVHRATGSGCCAEQLLPTESCSSRASRCPRRARRRAVRPRRVARSRSPATTPSTPGAEMWRGRRDVIHEHGVMQPRGRSHIPDGDVLISEQSWIASAARCSNSWRRRSAVTSCPTRAISLARSRLSMSRAMRSSRDILAARAAAAFVSVSNGPARWKRRG
jgi:hypothetical protein